MINEFYKKNLQKLIKYKIKDPELNLRLLIKKCTIKNNFNLLSDITVQDINLKKFNVYFSRRIKGEPLSKIFKNKEFWSLDFFTNKNVLDPRPETEFIIDAILKYYNKNKKFYICDLGIGSGCIIITILKIFSNAFGTGVDLSQDAVNIAKKNSMKHNISNRLNIYCKNWNLINEKFDIIVCNPPYIKNKDYYNLSKEVSKYDPKLSLVSGKTGLEKFKEVSIVANKCMDKASMLFLEIGYKQKNKVEKIFFRNNLKLIEVIKDFKKIDRIMVFKKTA